MLWRLLMHCHLSTFKALFSPINQVNENGQPSSKKLLETGLERERERVIQFALMYDSRIEKKLVNRKRDRVEGKKEKEKNPK